MNINNSAVAAAHVFQRTPVGTENATKAAVLPFPEASESDDQEIGGSHAAPGSLGREVGHQTQDRRHPTDWAEEYLEMGWAPIPVPYREKGPRIRDWPKLRIQADHVDKYFRDSQMNIGVLLGEPSGGLVDVDLDCPEALVLAPKFLPSTRTFGRNTKPRSHWLYRCYGAKTTQFKSPDGAMLLELRSTGHQTVFPGSTHPSGEEIKFENDAEIVDLDPKALARVGSRLGAAALLVRHWPASGSRQDTALALAGALLRHWNEDEVEEFIQVVAEAAGDEEVNSRVQCVGYTARKLNKGEPVTGIPRLRELVGTDIVERVVDWLGLGSAVPRWVEEMNARYLVVNEMGKALVYEITKDETLARDVLVRYAFEDLRKLYMNDLVMVEPKPGKESRPKDKASAWFGHRNRRQYLGGVVFAPGQTVSADKFNLWRGFAIEPSPGDWSLMRAHLLNVVCAGNKLHFEYLMNWLARMFQCPGEQGGVAVVLKGGRGTGKGTLGNAVARIIGQHALHITNSKHLTGNFNAHLRDAVFVFADEAFFAGDRAHESVLKGLITEPTLTIEAKHQNAVTAKNVTHILMASNEHWVVPAGEDERRFFVLEVSDRHKQDRAYFDAIHQEMARGGLAAMLHDLLQRDLSEFDVYAVPKTKALTDQKLHSLRGVQAWLRDCLQSAGIEGDDEWNEAGLVITKGRAYTAYGAWSARAHEYAPSSMAVCGKTIKKMLVDCVKEQRLRKKEPSAELANGVGSWNLGTSTERAREWVFAPIAECRAAFEKFMNAKIDWEEVHEE